VRYLNYFSEISKLLKSEISELLNMFGYYGFLFTKEEAKRIAEAKKTAESSIHHFKKYGMVGRGFNDSE